MKYIHKGKIVNLPKTHKEKNGRWILGFDRLEQNDPGRLITEGFLPVTVVNNEEYVPEIQIRTGQVITENADHAVLDYTVTDKPLAGIKKAKRKQIKQEGKAMIAAKYDETDELSRKFMTAAEETSMDTARDADITILTNYFKTTIKTKLAAANTPQKVKDLSYTWPTI
jgi:hypothetical protein